MNIQALISFGIAASIFLSVLTVGMGTSAADLRYVFGKPALLVKSVLAMSVLAPLVAILVAKMFSLHPAVIVALVTLAVAPVGALFSQSVVPLVTPGNSPYALGVFFASIVLSVVLTPLAVALIQWIFGGDVRIAPAAVAKVVISSVLLPLGIGLAIGRWLPAARRWIPAIERVSSLLLLVCLVLIIIGAWSLMASVVTQGTLLAIVIIALAWLAIGHFLGGPEEDTRTVLAFATVSRHPGVAIAVASLTNQELAPVGVLLAVVVSALAVVPYKMWRKRLRAAAAGTAGRSPPSAAH